MSTRDFQHLIDWSKREFAHLPWRRERSLYSTLVSEIMLQQTTVGTVLNHFEKFMKRYPDIFSMARASEEEVCVAWKGLGYYRRARNLRAIAMEICERFDGRIPADLNVLTTLKGVGPYTANALVAIGNNERALALDANLERVLARLFGLEEEKGRALQAKIYKEFWERKILKEMESLDPREINEALMDLGRVICQARKASCALCPLKSDCKAYQIGDPLRFPNGETKKESVEFFIVLLRVIVRRKEKILFYQKSEKEWLAGQWEVPTFILETNDDSLSQYPLAKNYKRYEKLIRFKTGITKYSIENLVLEMDYAQFLESFAVSKKEFQFLEFDHDLNLSTASIKALKLCEKNREKV